MAPKVVLTTGLTEQQAEDLLRQGALIVFGDQFLDAAQGLSGHTQGVPVMAGQRVADLKLPDTLMAFAIMIFAHTLPGAKGKPGTQSDLAVWKDKLFDRVDFVAGQEPMPAAEFSLTEGTRDVLTQLTWAAPASGNWQGVRSGQLRRIAAQFEARHDRAMLPDGGTSGSSPSGWRRFEHPDGMFSITYPPRWSERRVPGSGAAFSCTSDDGSEMLEVLVMRAGAPRAKDEVAQIAADGMVKDIKSRAGGRVVHRRVVAEGRNGACVSLKSEHHEAGEKYTTDYLFAGAGRDALYVALKCPSARFNANKADFDRACASLTAPWLEGTGHGTLNVQNDERGGAEEPSAPRWLWIVVIAGLMLLAAYLYAAGMLPPETK